MKLALVLLSLIVLPASAQDSAVADPVDQMIAQYTRQAFDELIKEIGENNTEDLVLDRIELQKSLIPDEPFWVWTVTYIDPATEEIGPRMDYQQPLFSLEDPELDYARTYGYTAPIEFTYKAYDVVISKRNAGTVYESTVTRYRSVQ